LTSTLSVPKVADFLIDYMLALPGNESVQSINPVVAETNDGFLNDIRSRPITRSQAEIGWRRIVPLPAMSGSCWSGIHRSGGSPRHGLPARRVRCGSAMAGR